MIIYAQAPTRISLFGGGTDIPPYKDGLVINMAINLRTKLKFYFDDDIFASANSIPPHANPDLFYEIFKEFGVAGMHHIKFVSESDAFIKSGLGTSGSAAVAAIAALSKYKGIKNTHEDIAEMAYRIENKLWKTGKQDVYAASFGGMNIFKFNGATQIMGLPPETARNIKKHLFLFYLGGEHTQQPNTLANLDAIKKIAELAVTQISYPATLGGLLDRSWYEKKKTDPLVTNPKIDKIYETAKDAGAWGGKICGRGGGGYAIFMTDKHDELVSALKEKGVEEIDFDIDYQGCEARII